jgi:hypothetical protein
MARYKRKKHLYSSAVGNGSQANAKDPTSTDFNSRQKTMIREYLDRYRREAKKFHDGESTLSDPAEEKEKAISNKTWNYPSKIDTRNPRAKVSVSSGRPFLPTTPIHSRLLH